MKIFLALILSVFAFSAHAQTYVINGGTNNVAAVSTNTYNTFIDLQKSQSVALQYSFTCLGTNTDVIRFRLFPSQDGTNVASWNSNYVFTVSASGTNVIAGFTNYAANGLRYLYLSTVSNPNTNVATAAATNLTLFYNIK